MFGMQGLFNSKKVDAVIMSPFKAHITYKGEPLKNAKVKLSYTWNDKDENIEYYKLDENGYISLPVIVRNIRTSDVFPANTNYQIEVEHESQSTIILSVGKSNLDLYGELGYEIESFTCDLTDSKLALKVDGLISTRCRWKQLDQHEVIEL